MTPPHDLAIVHATVLPMTGPPIERSTVLVYEGRIAAVGPDASLTPSASATVVDATGKFLLPGLLDAHSHMGVYPWPGAGGHGDGNEASEPITSRVWAGDGVRVDDPAFARARAGGVTAILVLPGSANLVGGEGVTLKLRPSRTLQGMRFEGAPRTLKMAMGENPKRVYGGKGTEGGPSTRMGNLSSLRLAFQAALDHRIARKTWREPPPRDLDLEVLHDVLDGKVLVQTHCYRNDDIESLFRLASAFGFRIRALHHALEAYKVRDLIAEHGAGVATFSNWWGFKMEAYDAIPENAALCASAGVKVAIKSDSADHVQRLFVEAAKCVSSGMPEDEALRSITLNPAWMLGVDQRVGSIEVGKDADLALFRHHPLDTTTLVEKTWIDGQLVFDRSVEGTPDARP